MRCEKHKLVKASGPDDLVFQSVQKGKPMNDQNVLRRHIKPAATALGLHVNWRCLRTSHATWLVQAGADPKSVQGQRHSRISTTMEIYAQIVPLAQRRALEQLSEFAKASATDARSDSRSITVQ
ncbi:MAG: tyrosine-type recombinase/integrase [Acidobacteriia bacterium]|nr:tyrosine-type recombinase/integrase [Terriglobia bacterium]